MIKECTPKFVLELNDYILNGRMKSLKIEKNRDTYYADYAISLDQAEVSMESKLKASSVLMEFGRMLALGMVESFSMYYEQDKGNCVASQAYRITSKEITRELKLDTLRAKIDTIESIVADLGLSDNEVKGLYNRKVTKGTKGKRGTNRYNLSSFSEVIEKISKELN